MEYLMDFAALGIVYIFIFYKRWALRGRRALLVNTMMYLYIVLVLYAALMPIIASLPSIFQQHYAFVNFVPFSDVLSGRDDAIRQVVLNIVMTIPFGFLLPLTNTEKPKLSKTVFMCFLLSLSIEASQFILNNWRSSDITDIITNTVGGAVGYGLYSICRPLINRILKGPEDG
mgnify:CR=1 FL=1